MAPTKLASRNPQVASSIPLTGKKKLRITKLTNRAAAAGRF